MTSLTAIFEYCKIIGSNCDNLSKKAASPVDALV